MLKTNWTKKKNINIITTTRNNSLLDIIHEVITNKTHHEKPMIHSCVGRKECKKRFIIKEELATQDCDKVITHD